MVAEEQSKPRREQGVSGQPSDPARRRGRPRRGGRGRGRGRRPQGPPAPLGQETEHAQDDAKTTQEPPTTEAEGDPVAEVSEPVQRRPEPPAEPVPEPRAAEPAAGKDAIEEVNRIIATLMDTLEETEEVLAPIEIA